MYKCTCTYISRCDERWPSTLRCRSVAFLWTELLYTSGKPLNFESPISRPCNLLIIFIYLFIYLFFIYFYLFIFIFTFIFFILLLLFYFYLFIYLVSYFFFVVWWSWVQALHLATNLIFSQLSQVQLLACPLLIANWSASSQLVFLKCLGLFDQLKYLFQCLFIYAQKGPILGVVHSLRYW